MNRERLRSLVTATAAMIVATAAHAAWPDRAIRIVADAIVAAALRLGVARIGVVGANFAKLIVDTEGLRGGVIRFVGLLPR